MTGNLYIIGNGFDLHHQIPSSYKAFGAYLGANDWETYDVVQRYFDVSAEFWAEMEERLASLDIDTLIDDASSSLVSYGAEDWSDAYHHDYQYEIDQVVAAVSSTLRLRFAEWIWQLPLPSHSQISGLRLPIDLSAIFLNFNYTPSLQQLYGVPDTNILHVHGKSGAPDSRLVLGHGWTPPPRSKPKPDEYPYDEDYDETDVRITEGQQIIDRYFKETFKPTAQIIIDNFAFFNSLSNISKIFVIGHSVSDVDHPYFREVIRNIDADHVRWQISYFGDPKDVRKRVKKLGIVPHLVEYRLLTEF